MSESTGIDVTLEELEEFLGRLQGTLDPEDFKIVRGMAETIRQMSVLLDKKRVSIDRLRQLLHGHGTEKTDKVLPDDAANDAGGADDESSSGKGKKKKRRKKRKGHGRNGVKDYPGADRVKIPHETLKKGHDCPECLKGKVYDMPEPATVVRIKGQPFLKGTIYEAQRLRCNLCHEIYKATFPPEVGEKKYDETTAAMIGILKYGTGLPFTRMDTLQKMLGIPVPTTVQWEIVDGAATELAPVHQALIDEAAQRDVVHNDDTTMKILGLDANSPTMDGGGGEDGDSSDKAGRTGIFTTGIVATGSGPSVALFFTGRNHAGENLEDVLRRRSENRDPPTQVCDGLNRNVPKAFATILGNCNAHARRKFVEIAPKFPDECRRVLEAFKDIYHNDALAREEGLDPAERLAFHQKKSGPIAEALKVWMENQISQKVNEPNSALGEAIRYSLNRWEKLTLFLREPGVPLDNNVVERTLKTAILHRKNALFYKTQRGADVGDLFMTLIHTCRLNQVNPFDYLHVLLSYAKAVEEDPTRWLPWNYEQAIPIDESEDQAQSSDTS